MFVGFAPLDQTFVSYALTKDQTDIPVQPDAPPAWQVYGADGPMTNGSGLGVAVDGVTGFYQLQIPTLGANGYELGTSYKVLVDYLVDGIAMALEQSFVVT